MTELTNPFRNGILNMVDILQEELKLSNFEFLIMRGRLKGALAKTSEGEAEYYIRKIRDHFNEVITNDEHRRGVKKFR